MKKEWRCFHCDELFKTSEGATEHFGRSLYDSPACQIDIAEYRRMQEVDRRHGDEDTDLHREIYAAESRRVNDVRRAEESGYLKGLEDAPGYLVTLEREISALKIWKERHLAELKEQQQ